MKTVRRGYLPDYESQFRGDGVAALREAAIDSLFLMNRGHSLKRATHFAMEHYQLSDAQRVALSRGLCTDAEIARRCATRHRREDAAGTTAFIDGFNAIILMESLVSASPVFLCMDGAVRDLANLKGSYHIIDKTEPAIRLILAELDSLCVQRAVVHIDSPVSNSRNLKALLENLAQEYAVSVEVHLIDACDKSFYGRDFVISGDGIVIDNAASWIPLYAWIVERFRRDHEAWIVDFGELSQGYRDIVVPGRICARK